MALEVDWWGLWLEYWGKNVGRGVWEMDPWGQGIYLLAPFCVSSLRRTFKLMSFVYLAILLRDPGLLALPLSWSGGKSQSFSWSLQVCMGNRSCWALLWWEEAGGDAVQSAVTRWEGPVSYSFHSSHAYVDSENAVRNVCNHLHNIQYLHNWLLNYSCLILHFIS